MLRAAPLPRSGSRRSVLCVLALGGAVIVPQLRGDADAPLRSFRRDIQPVLEEYCYDCHGDGAKKGGVRLDGFATDAAITDHALWLRVMKNVRAGIMPPAEEPRPPAADVAKLMHWIKVEAFGLDLQHPDPGRVTVRRLNRVEYRNTIRDLIGVDYDTEKEFPPDDTGQGFDNLADVLTISPMLLERYLDAAQTIVAEAVPTQPRAVAEVALRGRDFATIKVDAPATLAAAPGALVAENSETSAPTPAPMTPAVGPFKRPVPQVAGEGLDLSYYTPAIVATRYAVKYGGQYQVTINLRAIESYVDDQFDLNRCRLLFKADGETLFNQEFVREGDKSFEFTFDRTWTKGEHELAFEVQPVGPDRDQKRMLRVRINAVTIHGPLAETYWVQPKAYARFFPRKVPWRTAARHAYAAELLRDFATRAYRRPADPATVERLAAMADQVAAQPRGTFEAGVAQAMVAVLASPRFIFREEDVEPPRPGQAYPEIDEYALASRLSYFFWSSMPDTELFRLAGAHRLRAELPAQIDRMLRDRKAHEFIRNFTGQWLEARDIGNVQINSFDVYLREHPNPAVEAAQATFRRINQIPEDQRTPAQKAAFAEARQTFLGFLHAPRPDLNWRLRDAMRRETEMVFARVINEDRSLLELIDSNYTYLNEELAKHYGIPGVTGPEMRLVTLPPGSPRGGVLTQGTVLAVTSNPTRTSPVKRGVFVLDAILGARPPPPPPNIPALEDAASPEKLRQMSLRENLALHASNKMCASCHSRMDPLGLALENFNAMGAWRDSEFNRPIEPAGRLITGEKFADVRELKHILAHQHRRDFYYCFAQKLLTYALGRSLEYYDTETIDELVAKLEAAGGRPSALLQGIVMSAPFQQRRPVEREQVAAVSAGPVSTPATRLAP
ncbi:MAG TPA: DUF1592 domain-containing protein [Lacunisphaera sp.]|nr:DUF1592 domain-containing protein [Lacunisphaera sp.]